MAYNAGTMNLGEFEHVVLLAILRLGENAYAIPIREEIEERTGRSVARGALYTALERLESKRCLRSRMSDPLPERGGRSRRYFTVTPTGIAAIRASRAMSSQQNSWGSTPAMRPPSSAETIINRSATGSRAFPSSLT